MKRMVVGLIAALPFALGAGVAQAHEGQWGHDGYAGSSSSGPVVAVAGIVTSAPDANGNFTANVFMPRGDEYSSDQSCSDSSGSGDDNDQGDQSSQGDDSGSSDGSGTSGDSGSSWSGSSWSGSQSGGSQSGGESGDARPRDAGSSWGGGDGSAPALTPVTIPTNSSTVFQVNGQPATASDLAPGDRFVALFSGTPCDSLSTLTSQPAVAINAHSPESEHQLYAFVGTLQSVDTTANTITVNVTNSLPNGLSGPTTFSVSDATAILGGSSSNGLYGGSLSNLTPGDVIAGAEVGPSGQSWSQVESTPLSALVDFPTTASSGTTMSSSLRRQARTRAFEQALALFGHRSVKATSHRATRRHARGTRRERRVRARRHARLHG